MNSEFASKSEKRNDVLHLQLWNTFSRYARNIFSNTYMYCLTLVYIFKLQIVVNTRLHLGSLPANFTEQHLHEYFSSFGKLVDVHITNQGHKGFIEYEKKWEADQVLQMKRHIINGFAILPDRTKIQNAVSSRKVTLHGIHSSFRAIRALIASPSTFEI